MVVKDFECSECGAVHEDMVSGDCEAKQETCAKCNSDVIHVSIIGGLKRRYRFMDWHNFDFSGHIQFEGVRAESEDGEPVKDLRTGAAMEYKGDAVDSRRDVYKSNVGRARGQAPMFFTYKG